MNQILLDIPARNIYSKNINVNIEILTKIDFLLLININIYLLNHSIAKMILK